MCDLVLRGAGEECTGPVECSDGHPERDCGAMGSRHLLHPYRSVTLPSMRVTTKVTVGVQQGTQPALSVFSRAGACHWERVWRGCKGWL